MEGNISLTMILNQVLLFEAFNSIDMFNFTFNSTIKTISCVYSVVIITCNSFTRYLAYEKIIK